jgi:hypothetical protein
MGFGHGMLWVIGYEGVMGSCSGTSANQLGGSKILWG